MTGLLFSVISPLSMNLVLSAGDLSLSRNAVRHFLSRQHGLRPRGDRRSIDKERW